MKTMVIVLDLILIIILVLVIPFFVLNIFNILRITIGNKTVPNILVIISQVILMIISFILIVYLINLLNKTNFNTISQILISKYSSNKVGFGVLFILTLIFVAVTILIVKQRSLIYIPNFNEKAHNEISNNNKYKTVEIKDGTFNYIGYLKNDLEDKPLIIYYGGNADSAANIFSEFQRLENSLFNNFNFLMVDYPKYGLSSNSLNEENIFNMALLTFDYATIELGYKNSEIIVMGYSLGSGVASYVASKRATKTNVLIAPYNSISNVANTILPIFYGPFENLIKDPYSSNVYVKDINVKTLVIASKKDKVIKYKLTKKLIENIKEYKLIEFNNLSHSDFLEETTVHEAIASFILDE